MSNCRNGVIKMHDEKQYVDYDAFKHYDDLLKRYIYDIFHKNYKQKDKEISLSASELKEAQEYVEFN